VRNKWTLGKENAECDDDDKAIKNIYCRINFASSHLMFMTFLFLFIAAIPQHPPKIVGLEDNYYDDDYLFGNCSSDFSYPAPVMSWFINNEKADPTLMQPYHEQRVEAYGLNLTQRSLEIRFRLNKILNPFIANSRRITMKCIVQIRQMPAHLREAEHTFVIHPPHENTHLKLINWKNSG
jgi:hypothetical protein